MIKIPKTGAPRRAPTTVGLLLSAGLLHGCAMFFSAPDVEIVDVQILSLGLTSGTAEVVLEVTNDGRRQMDIRGFLYEIEVRGPEEGEGWISLAEGFRTETISIAGSETRRVTVPVPFQYSAVGAALRSFLSEGEVPYRLKGEVWMGGASSGLQLPFRSEGVITP
jgi:LEA14-like dessication related protein